MAFPAGGFISLFVIGGALFTLVWYIHGFIALSFSQVSG